MKEGNNKKFIFSTEVSKDNNKDLISNPFQKEFIFFKNEILKDINLLIKDITEKYEKHYLFLNSETSKLNELIKNSEKKINNLTNLISISNHIQSVLESLTAFQKKTESYIITNDIRFLNLSHEVSDNISRHDNIIKDSVIYPGIIGPSAQFQNFHELIDYFLKQITEMLSYKEKNTMDLIQYKTRLDNKINMIKTQLDDFIDDISHQNKKEFNKMEGKINDFSLKIDEIVDSYKIENEKNLDDIKQKNKEFMDKVEENIKSINEDNDSIKKKLKKIAHRENKENKEGLNDYTNNKKFISFKKQNIKKGKSVTNFNDIISYNSTSSKIVNKNKNFEKKITKESINSKNSTSRFIKENNNESNDNESNDSQSKSKSKVSSSYNIEIKSLENRLKQFIKEEFKKISKNNNFNYSISTSTKSINKENLIINSPSYNINKKKSQKSLSNVTPFIPKLKDNVINIKNKRPSFSSNNNPNNDILEKYMSKKEEKKEYNFEKIKEVFIEESFESSGSYPEISKMIDKDNEKEKNRNNISVTEENITLTLQKPEFKKDINYRKSYKTTTHLPILTKKIKPKKEKLKEKIKSIPEIINQRKSINIKKTPLKKSPIKRASLKSLSGSMSFSSRKDINNLNNIKKELYKQNSFKNNKEQKSEYKKTLEINLENNNEINLKKDLNKENIIQNEIEIKNKTTRIKSPQNRPIPRLSNFGITLQGTQKLNINAINNKDKKYIFNSPTIYMNFPRKFSIYNEKVLESLHPIYRNKKFSNYITPYISLMTNNLQKMIRENDRKSILQRKRNLPWNRSETFLLNKNTQTQTNPQAKENINIKKEKYNYKKFGKDNKIKLNDENDMIDFNKFSYLIMKDI